MLEMRCAARDADGHQRLPPTRNAIRNGPDGLPRLPNDPKRRLRLVLSQQPLPTMRRRAGSLGGQGLVRGSRRAGIAARTRCRAVPRLRCHADQGRQRVLRALGLAGTSTPASRLTGMCRSVSPQCPPFPALKPFPSDGEVMVGPAQAMRISELGLSGREGPTPQIPHGQALSVPE
jgi:hypothetical protein